MTPSTDERRHEPKLPGRWNRIEVPPLRLFTEAQLAWQRINAALDEYNARVGRTRKVKAA